MIKLSKGSAIPLYLQVKEGLLAQINSGAFTPDVPIPTEHELADSLGLSRLTVRRSIVELAREGLVRRIPGRGTFIVSGAAKAPITAVALILSDDIPLDLSSSFTGNLLHGLHAASLPASLSLRQVPDDVRDLRDIQGIVALWAMKSQVLKRLAESGIPLVAYESPADAGGPIYDTIGHANEAGAFEAVSALINLGHSDIACVTHPTSVGNERRSGYERAMLKHGLPIDPQRILTTLNSGESGYALGRRMFADPSKAPTALFCSDDTVANGAMAGVQSLGLKVPEFVSIVGFGDLGLFSTPSLSSVRMDIRASGRDAIRLLKERAANPSLPARHLVLPTEFIRRASCGAVR